MKIFNVLVNLCEEQSVYVEPFMELLKNCVKRFLLDRSTDAEIYSSALIAFYSDFGRLKIIFFFSSKENISIVKDIFFVYQINVFNNVFSIHCTKQFNQTINHQYPRIITTLYSQQKSIIYYEYNVTVICVKHLFKYRAFIFLPNRKYLLIFHRHFLSSKMIFHFVFPSLNY
jgi:hypothetical protein